MEHKLECPFYGNASIIEHVVMVDMEEKKIYRCLACGKEFSVEELLLVPLTGLEPETHGLGKHVPVFLPSSLFDLR